MDRVGEHSSEPMQRWTNHRLQIGTCLLCWQLAIGIASGQAVKIGAKSFTESNLLGQICVLLARDSGLDAELTELHGTRLAWSALLSGDIDVYPEYTGTIRQEIFAGEPLADDDAIRVRLAAEGIGMGLPLGFNNTYALGMKESQAAELGIETISDLKHHPELRVGFSNEFMDRGDGWPSLSSRYGLKFKSVTGLEHGLAYRAVDVDEIEITDVYSTDPNIRHYGLRVLLDDLAHFPKYNAVFLYRLELKAQHGPFVDSLGRLSGRFDEDRMQSLNEQVEIAQQTPLRVAADFVREELGVQAAVIELTLLQRVARRTKEHLTLVAISLAAAVAVSLPLGIVAAKNPTAGHFILGIVEVIQTVPGLALLVFIGALFLMAGLPMIGGTPVVAALFFYSLLPIVRNTAAGIRSVPNSLQESATALGLAPLARLSQIELPLASPMIFAGVKTAAVISVGYAALGGLIGAGGYGQPIMTGLRLNNLPLMLEGAIPAACLALLVKVVFELCEQRLVPRGLRVS